MYRRKFKHTAVRTKKSFKARIILPMILVLSTLVIIMNIFLATRFSVLRDDLVNERLAASVNSLKLYLADCGEGSKAAALSMASNPAAVKAIEERDRKALLDLFIPTHSLYRVTYYTICDSEGVVLARSYAPERYGDSIANQRNVKNALEGRITTYFEAGTAVRVGVRTGAPVYGADGTLVGIVSAGVMFDTEEAVDDLKDLFRSDVTVVSGDTRIATTILKDGRRAVGTKIDPAIAKVLIEERQEYSDYVDIFGKRYKSFYKPLFNAHDEPFAAIFLGIPVADLEAKSNKSIRDGILLGLGGLVVSILLLFYIISYISNPIIKLSRDVKHLADGDLDIEINVEGEDEVGYLGRSVQAVAGTLHKLVTDVNVMIAEHDMGNTDYYLNAEEFLGAYKALAGNVLDLTDIGMRDPLTGIPNRRSFDSRLKMEWGRALREKKAISILFLDVDRFKLYNDTHGHQQGDMALKTVAQALKDTVHRSADFAARWGGEEFVVLLPGTDSDGAMAVAEKVRIAIERAIIPAPDPKAANTTVSIGVNSRIPAPDISLSDFISEADAALYKAKETGRNRAVLAEGVS